MTLTDVTRLVKSLSASEKRQLQILSDRHTGNKDYMQLFRIIERNSQSIDVIKQKFAADKPTTSLVNTSQYLGKVILRCLVDCKKENDIFFQRLHELMEIKILQERSFYDEGLTRIKKTRKSVIETQQPWLEYVTYRYELDYYAENNFLDLSDDQLIGLQMKARENLKSLNYIQEHHSLFEMLKYRLIHTGKINSDEEKKKMNDLILSEMTLVTSKTKQQFVTQKLHLLFQAFFFTNTGEYKTALKTLNTLNDLFEKNPDLLEFPPMDYLSTLNGIMDSLLALKKTDEINVYLNKTRLLDSPVYPEYFRTQVKKICSVYELAVYINDNRLDEAILYLKELNPATMKILSMVSEEKQWELYFYCSLIYVKLKNWKKAHQYIVGIMQIEKARPHLLICRAVRLLNIIVYYEREEADYLEYEVRSYKRFIAKNPTRFRTEKLLLKFVTKAPGKKTRIAYSDSKSMQSEIAEIGNDRYESQLLKYYNFPEWIAGRLKRKNDG